MKYCMRTFIGGGLIVAMLGVCFKVQVKSTVNILHYATLPIDCSVYKRMFLAPKYNYANIITCI